MPAVALPSVQTDEVLTGVARMFLCPYIAGGSSTSLPANTVMLNDPWPTPWTAMGGTEKGMTLTFKRKTNDIMIEEQDIPVDVVIESSEFNIDVSLMQDSLKTIKLAYGGGTITTTAATSSLPATQRLVISGALDKLTFGGEGINQFGFWRRLRLPKCVSISEAKTMFRRSEARNYDVSLRGLSAVGDIDLVEMTAPVTTGP